MDGLKTVTDYVTVNAEVEILIILAVTTSITLGAATVYANNADSEGSDSESEIIGQKDGPTEIRVIPFFGGEE